VTNHEQASKPPPTKKENDEIDESFYSDYEDDSSHSDVDFDDDQDSVPSKRSEQAAPLSRDVMKQEIALEKWNSTLAAFHSSSTASMPANTTLAQTVSARNKKSFRNVATSTTTSSFVMKTLLELFSEPVEGQQCRWVNDSICFDGLFSQAKESLKLYALFDYGLEKNNLLEKEANVLAAAYKLKHRMQEYLFQ